MLTPAFHFGKMQEKVLGMMVGTVAGGPDSKFTFYMFPHSKNRNPAPHAGVRRAVGR